MVFNVFSWENKGGKGPWGSSKGGSRNTQGGQGRQQNQADLDDVLRAAQDHFRRKMRGGHNGGGNGGTGGSFKSIGFVLALLFAAWVVSGFYIVDQAERGIVLRFGAYTKTTTPGLNYHLPWPIETVLTPVVERENRVEIGFRNATPVRADLRERLNRRSAARRTDFSLLTNEALMLTGDENIVDLNFTVRWKIDDAKAYLFHVVAPEITIKDVAESAMREIIGKRPIDDALTANRAEIELAAQDLIQSIMDGYNTGVKVNAVELQQVNPPEPVIESFKDVQAARADAEKVQNEAQGYANDIIPRARGKAAEVIQQAEAYKAAKVLEAQGQAERFKKQLSEYSKAKNVTRERLYIEAMENVLQKSNVVVLSNKTNGNVLPYLPLGQKELKK